MPNGIINPTKGKNMKTIEISKCKKCGGEKIVAEERQEEGIKIACQKCGYAVLIPASDTILDRFVARNQESFREFKMDYIATIWNRENEKTET